MVWRLAGVLLAVVLVCASAHGQQPESPQPAHIDRTGTAAASHGSGVLQVVARLFNFVVLVGVLVYYFKTPVAEYLTRRHTQIRHDLTTAHDVRAAARAQMEEIEAKLRSLPAELDRLKARGEEDVRVEKTRIAQAAAAERERLLEQTRREIEMRLRIIRRELVDLGAELAVRVARERITKTMTRDDQLRLVDRYTIQLTEAH